MTQKVIDDVAVLTSPQLMMQAIDDNFDELYAGNAGAGGEVSDEAYDATSWNAVGTVAPSKNAVRDKVVAMDAAIATNTAKETNVSTNLAEGTATTTTVTITSSDGTDAVLQPASSTRAGLLSIDKFNEIGAGGGGGAVNVKDYGAVGNGTTDDKTAILSAATSLGAAGGTVYFPPGKYLVDTALTLPKHITLKGTYNFVGATEAVQYPDMSALIINGAVTITLEANAGLFGMLIYRKGLTFPADDDTAFVGTALTFNGSDCFVHNSRMLGFNTLIYSSGNQRPDIKNVQGDAINGIVIDGCWDIARLSDVHMWPFATFYNPTKNDRRSGVAFKFTNGGDWNKVTNCFCWGYNHGFEVSGCNSITFLNCGADGPNIDVGTIGFMVSGDTTDTRFIGCQAAGQSYAGYLIDTLNGRETRFIDCDSWGCEVRCLLVESGNVSITGGALRDTPIGVQINNAASEIFYNGVNNKCTTPYQIVTSPVQFYHGVAYTQTKGWMYPEGEWTPVCKFGGVSSSGATYKDWNLAKYVRDGQCIHISGQLAVQSKGSSTGDFTIGNLPFLNGAGSATWGAISLWIENITFSGQVQARLLGNNNVISLHQVTEGGVATALTNSNVNDGVSVNFSFTYFTDDKVMI